MNDNEEQEGQTGHQAIITDSWLRAREYIRRAEGTEMNPQRALWDVENPHRHYQHALAAHAATMQFRDDIYAFREERAQENISELWETQIHTVDVAGSTIEISLESLEAWAHQYHEKTRTHVSVIDGEQTETTRYRVLLPVATCRRAYRHMQDILHELGFTAETAEHTDDGEATPEDLVGLLDERGQKEAKGQLPARFTKGRTDTESET